MTNSHILVHEFTYMEPASVAEAIRLLATHGEAARVLAGGTDLLVQMKMERLKPAVLIGIRKLAELKGIRHDAGKLTIGADYHPRRPHVITSRYTAGRGVRRQYGPGAGDGHRQPVQRLTGLRHRPGAIALPRLSWPALRASARLPRASAVRARRPPPDQLLVGTRRLRLLR
jgi:hypothetical protein